MHEFSLETHLSKDMTRRFSGILIIGVLPSFETFGIPLYSRRQQDRDNGNGYVEFHVSTFDDDNVTLENSAG